MKKKKKKFYLRTFVGVAFRKKELLVQTRQKQEDLEFQLMELETRYEAELEQAEEHFQAQRILVTQNAKMRQVSRRRFSSTNERKVFLSEHVERFGSSATDDFAPSDDGKREIRT